PTSSSASVLVAHRRRVMDRIEPFVLANRYPTRRAAAAVSNPCTQIARRNFTTARFSPAGLTEKKAPQLASRAFEHACQDMYFVIIQVKKTRLSETTKSSPIT
ncbi:unnamed protein product, partial [Ectocarpus sp. 8 AP-2014]